MAKLFVNNLTIIDSSLLDHERGLVGESWRVDVELEGELNAQGMVLDFAEIKRQVKQTIDQHFDHKLLVPAASPNCRISEQSDITEIAFQLDCEAWIRHRSPTDAVSSIDTDHIDQESLAAAITQKITATLPENVRSFQLSLRHETTSDPSFHYSHGLKLHGGNCQRIAHGHRSRIEIYQDGTRNHALETEWAERWLDIYIGTRDDLTGESIDDAGEKYLHFGYQTKHGRFQLELPQRFCYLIDSDSTVENLAQHIADKLKQDHPDSGFQVRVFEGVDKGAISTP
jgi:6-pyruvoyl-tetrahydropterin synthase